MAHLTVALHGALSPQHPLEVARDFILSLTDVTFGSCLPPSQGPQGRAAKARLEPAQAQPLPTDHLPLGAEESVALKILVVLALCDVRKHFVMHLVCCAVGDSERQVASVTRLRHRGLTTSREPLRASPLSSRKPAIPLHQGGTLGLASWAIHGVRESGETQARQEGVVVKTGGRASLVAQWLRIRLPMQGTRVRALVREDPTCRGATKPVRHNY